MSSGLAEEEPLFMTNPRHRQTYVFLKSFADSSALLMSEKTSKFVKASTFVVMEGELQAGTRIIARQSAERAEMLLFASEKDNKLVATSVNYSDEFSPMFLTQDGSSSTMVQALQYGWRIPGVFKDLSLTNTSAMSKFMECMSAGRVSHKPPTVWVLLANKWNYGGKWFLAQPYVEYLRSNGLPHANKHFGDFLAQRKYHKLIQASPSSAAAGPRTVIVDEEEQCAKPAPLCKTGRRAKQRAANSETVDLDAVKRQLQTDIRADAYAPFQRSLMVLHYADPSKNGVVKFLRDNDTGMEGVVVRGQQQAIVSPEPVADLPYELLRMDKKEQRMDFAAAPEEWKETFFTPLPSGSTFHSVDWPEGSVFDSEVLLCKNGEDRMLVGTGAQSVVDADSWLKYASKWIETERTASKLANEDSQSRGASEVVPDLTDPTERKQYEFYQLYGALLGAPARTPQNVVTTVANWSELVQNCIKIRDTMERLGWGGGRLKHPESGALLYKGISMPYCDFTHKRGTRMQAVQRMLEESESLESEDVVGCGRGAQLFVAFSSSAVPHLKTMADRLELLDLDANIPAFLVHRENAASVRSVLHFLDHRSDKTDADIQRILEALTPFVEAINLLNTRYFNVCTLKTLQDGKLEVHCENPKQRVKQLTNQLCLRSRQGKVAHARFNRSSGRFVHPGFSSEVHLHVTLSGDDAETNVQQVRECFEQQDNPKDSAVYMPRDPSEASSRVATSAPSASLEAVPVTQTVSEAAVEPQEAEAQGGESQESQGPQEGTSPEIDQPGPVESDASTLSDSTEAPGSPSAALSSDKDMEVVDTVTELLSQKEDEEERIQKSIDHILQAVESPPSPPPASKNASSSTMTLHKE